MKRILAALTALILAIQLPAQDASIIDGDAANYIQAQGVTDVTAINNIHKFYRGLKNLNVYTSIVWMASMRTQDGAIVGNGIKPFVGGQNGGVAGNPYQCELGLILDGSNSKYVTFTNPLPATLSAYSIAVAFSADTPTSSAALIGGFTSGAGGRGPLITVHGSPTGGLSSYGAYQYASSDGTIGGQPAGLITAPGFKADYGVSSKPQFLVTTMSTTKASILPDTGAIVSTNGTFSTVSNPIGLWYVGRNVDVSVPSLNGTLAFVAIFNTQLTDAQAYALRRLYANTIGYGYLPRVNLIFEGDNLTAGGNGEVPYPIQILTDNSSVFGKITTVSAIGSASSALTGNMLSEIPTQLAPYNIQFGNNYRQYSFVFGGMIDIIVYGDATLALNNLKAYWAQARAYGYKVVAFTVPRMAAIELSASVQNRQNQEAARQSLNASIRALKTSYDYLIDLDARPDFKSGSAPGYYQVDGISLTTVGHAAIKDEILKVIPNP